MYEIYLFIYLFIISFLFIFVPKWLDSVDSVPKFSPHIQHL
jgi:hypothetical protein